MCITFKIINLLEKHIFIYIYVLTAMYTTHINKDYIKDETLKLFLFLYTHTKFIFQI